jgi:hypothetical protein
MRRRKSETEAPFAQLSRAYFESAALAAVSLGARRILDRLIVEHLTHYGKANGRLIVPYGRLAVHAGVDKSDVSSALAELVDVGLIGIQHGQWSTSTKRFPNRYRLTFFAAEGAAPTHEWKRFEPSEGAGYEAREAALKRAREIARAARRRGFRGEAEAKAASGVVEANLTRIGRTPRKPGNAMTRAALAEHAGTAQTEPSKNNFRRASRTPTAGCESHPRNTPRRSASRTPNSRGASRTLDSISREEGGGAGGLAARGCAAGGGAGTAREQALAPREATDGASKPALAQAAEIEVGTAQQERLPCPVEPGPREGETLH